jgi:tetratricopeptide (TPR) repeat protein
LNPDHEWGYSNLACVYCETKQWELAKRYAEIALNIRIYGDALVSLGRALLGLGQLQDALRVLERATNVPNYPYPFYYLALVYEQLQDPAQVVKFLQDALSIKLDYKDAQQMLDKYI